MSSSLVSLSLSDPACLAPCLHVFSCLRIILPRAFSPRISYYVLLYAFAFSLFYFLLVSGLSRTSTTSDLCGSFSPFRPSTFVQRSIMFLISPAIFFLYFSPPRFILLSTVNNQSLFVCNTKICFLPPPTSAKFPSLRPCAQVAAAPTKIYALCFIVLVILLMWQLRPKFPCPHFPYAQVVATTLPCPRAQVAART